MKFRLLIIATWLMSLTACSDSDSSSALVVNINGSNTAFNFYPTTPPFEVEWRSQGYTSIYLSVEPSVKSLPRVKLASTEQGSGKITCSIDSSYNEISCRQDNFSLPNTRPITAMIQQLPTSLYIIAYQDDVQFGKRSGRVAINLN